MASHMKTTIQIADSLFEDARRVAREERTTLRALVEEGLRAAITGAAPAPPARLPPP